MTRQHHHYNKQIFVSVLFAILGFSLVLLNTAKASIGITHDSAAYIYAAKSFSLGKGFQYFGYPSPFIQWPPLFPGMLSLIAKIGFDIIEVTRYLNAIVLGAILYVSSRWAYSNFRNPRIAFITATALLFSYPLIFVSSFLWTEPLFILFFMLFFIHFDKYLQTSAFKHLLWAAAFTSFACLTRYMGVVMVLSACLFMLLQKGKDFFKKIQYIFIFGTISVTPTILWIIRNYLISHTLVGMRTPADATLKKNILLSLSTLFQWVFPYKEISSILHISQARIQHMVFAVFLFTILLVLALVLYYKLWSMVSLKRLWDSIPLSIIYMILYAILYIIYLILSATAVSFDPIGDRYMIPSLIPVFLCLMFFTDKLMSDLRVKSMHGARTLTLLFALWLILLVSNTVIRTNLALSKGIGGYTTPAAVENTLVDYLQKNPLPGQLYSNQPGLIYINAGIEAFYTPKKIGLPMYGFESFNKAVASSHPSYIAWFKGISTSTIYNIDDLRDYFQIEKIVETPDGDIYKIYKGKEESYNHVSEKQYAIY